MTFLFERQIVAFNDCYSLPFKTRSCGDDPFLTVDETTAEMAIIFSDRDHVWKLSRSG